MIALLASACSGPQPGGAATATPGPASPDTMASARPDTPSPAASAGGSSGMESAVPALSSDPLHAVTVVDVSTGEQLTIGQLAADKPLLLETMAIWCSNCRTQQKNVRAAHVHADFHSISLDVDPGEQPDDLAVYAQREDFDWHFAMADAELLGQLRERFGTAVAVPPAMPKILFRTDGSIELIGLGELFSAEQIIDVVNG